MSLNKKVTYLGDDSISGAARYLSGVMKHFGISFDRVDSTCAPAADFFKEPYSLYILSDYPRANFRPDQLEKIARNVENEGSGLLMIGGWESFHGRLGEYHQTVLADVLPVIMAEEDDRRNWPLPLIMRTVKNHPTVAGLPWNTPPGIGGYNAFTPKQDSELIIEGIRIDLQVLGDDVDLRDGGDAPFTSSKKGYIPNWRMVFPLIDGDSVAVCPVEQVPLLVTGHYGEGRTAAFASDVAPHWVGGFVDWGTPRITEPIGVEGDFIEVGCDYAKFWNQLVRWTGNL